MPSMPGEEAPPDLAAVEAAIARLEGRDPTLAADVALARRDGERRREELKAVVDDAQRRVEAQEERKRRVIPIAAGSLIVLVGLGAGLYVNFAARQDAEESLHVATRKAAAAFLASGWKERSFHTESTVSIRSEPGTCYLAVASSPTGPAEVRLERGVESARGSGSAAWCGCSNVEVQVSTTGRAALQILLVSAETFGGADHVAALSPAPSAHLPETEDRACAERAVDGLVALAPVETSAPPDEAAERLVEAGLQLLGKVPATARFARVPDTEKTCFFVRSEGEGDTLTLRSPGGARPLTAKGTGLAFCQDKGSAGSVWREGSGALWLFAAPLARAGGVLGLSETLARAGFASAPIHRPAELFDHEARAILLASGATEAHLVEGQTSLLGSSLPPFLMAFASADKSTAIAIASDRGAVACDPPLSTTPTSALCLGPLEAFEGTKVRRANRPEWLRVGADPAAYGEVLQLLALSRRLSLLGFQPSSLAGVTPTPLGADVVGRAGEGAVVAVAVTSKPPYVRPLTDGPAWTITGDPQIVPVAPGARVSLSATPPYTAIEERGAVVIFRR